MLDNVLDSLQTAGRSTPDKVAGALADGAGGGFAGLLNLDSLPELPLQAYLPDVASDAADTPDSDALTSEMPASSLQQGAWLLVQAAGGAPVAASVNVDLVAADADIASPVSAAMRTALQSEVAPALTASAQPTPAGVPERPVDAAQAAMVSDTPSLEVGAMLADAHAVKEFTSEGEGLLKSMALSTNSANSNSAPSVGAAPVAGVASPTSALAPAQPTQAVPVADLAQHTVATIRHQGADQAEVRMSLHPAELGALDLQIEQDGKRLELSITVDSDAARRAVNEHMASLRERLGDSGMQLARLDVSVRDQGERQNADTPAPATDSGHDEGVKNSPQVAIALPADGLDLYA